MSEAASSSYTLLDPHIQRWIWRQKWEHLRDVQEQAIPAVLSGEQDVLISAATASGKTEAAFFPALTGLLQAKRADQDPAPLLLYVAPLKALINDQFGRLELLTEGTDLALTPWHGDASASRKTRFGKMPEGVLLITPESLEALFVRRGPEISRLFGGLRQIIIDEWHAFIGTERGIQLQSHMNRLEVVLQRRIPRVGLSATLGDMSLAANELRPGERESVIPILSTNDQQALQVQLRGYERSPPRTSSKKAEELNRQGKDIPIEDVTHGDHLVICDHLFRHLRGRSNLIFANRKRDVELYAELLKRKSEEQRLSEEFFVHHGSLSRDLRHHVEQSLKAGKPLSVVCTSTLEMGVDIGSVASIAQIGPPHQVASLRQRLGRSGRREDPAVLRLYITESSLSPQTPFLDRLRPGIYQSVAMVELLVEGWCEPPPSGYLHLSTLIQQVLSLIAQYGGASASDLWRSLIKSGPFRQLSQTQFTALLRAMGANGLLVQSTGGLLLHGPVGERLVNHYDFYSAFSAPEEYTLYHGAKAIGQLPIDSPIETGGRLVFAGRRWLIQAIDADKKSISLMPSAGGVPPIFGGNSGLVRREVRERMRKLYIETNTPNFLNRGAARLFDQGGALFRDAKLEFTPIVQEGDQTLLLPWQSDQVLNTLALLLRRYGLEAEREGVAVSVQTSDSDIVLRGLEHAFTHPPISASELARVAENKINEKYDEYLSEELLCNEFASRFLDLEGALETARTLFNSCIHDF